MRRRNQGGGREDEEDEREEEKRLFHRSVPKEFDTTINNGRCLAGESLCQMAAFNVIVGAGLMIVV